VKPLTTRLRLYLPCAGIAVLLAAGLYIALTAAEHAPATLAGPPNNAGQAAAGRADRMVAEILKRPLFTPGRRAPETRIVKAEPPKLQGRLAGVVLRPDLREALFTRPGGRPVSIKEGEVIDGWTAAKIEAGQVVLTSSFGEQIVKLTNGTPDEITPGRRPAKKAVPTKNQGPTPGQKPNPVPAQKQQQITQAVAAGSMGQR
jgi:hypothetical protein